MTYCIELTTIKDITYKADSTFDWGTFVYSFKIKNRISITLVFLILLNAFIVVSPCEAIIIRAKGLSNILSNSVDKVMEPALRPTARIAAGLTGVVLGATIGAAFALPLAPVIGGAIGLAAAAGINWASDNSKRTHLTKVGAAAGTLLGVATMGFIGAPLLGAVAGAAAGGLITHRLASNTRYGGRPGPGELLEEHQQRQELWASEAYSTYIAAREKCLQALNINYLDNLISQEGERAAIEWLKEQNIDEAVFEQYGQAYQKWSEFLETGERIFLGDTEDLSNEIQKAQQDIRWSQQHMSIAQRAFGGVSLITEFWWWETNLSSLKNRRLVQKLNHPDYN